MIITIDGYAASGKSTIASLLAKDLGFNHLNSGLIFRAISFHLLLKNISVHNLESKLIEVQNISKQYKIDYKKIEKNIENFKNQQVSELGVQIAKLPFIRLRVIEILRELAKESNIVVEGRDIGTVVFPNADIKFFFYADIEVRIERLIKESGRRDFYSMKKAIELRDYEDINRAISPLIRADDAIEIDTGIYAINEILSFIKAYIDNKSIRSSSQQI